MCRVAAAVERSERFGRPGMMGSKAIVTGIAILEAIA
jgi:hypothetical protein